MASFACHVVYLRLGGIDYVQAMPLEQGILDYAAELDAEGKAREACAVRLVATAIACVYGQSPS